MSTSERPRLSLFRSWISLMGLIVTIGSGFAFLFLLVMDIFSAKANAYLGILAYLLVPAFVVFGLALIALGLFFERRRARKTGGQPALLQLDFSQPRIRRNLVLVVTCGVTFILLASVAAYRSYHFSESVAFCGTVCHEVMKPEYTAFKQSPHANSACTECHIGPGAEWFVKAKVSGLYQVYSVMFNKYHRPIETPVKNLRPAKETCLGCHWPSKFFGAVLRTWTYYKSDEKNSPWTIKMLLNIGGGNPAHGPIRGIHWHMEGVNTVEYIATDAKRLVIPWVRVRDQNGKEIVYQTEAKDQRISAEQMTSLERRTMDCIDCHNRPSHQYRAPNELLDMSLAAGRIDSSLPSIKARAAKLMAGSYTNEAQALAAIEHGLKEQYPNEPRIDPAISEVQALYSANFFPEMKVRWDQYPSHIGHRISPGCFRCHDGKHVSEDGQKISNDCKACHTILAQGPGKDLPTFTSAGLDFQHPEDIGDDWKTERCDTCHTGAP